MVLLASKELISHTTNVYHGERQHHKFTLDLTVAEIHQFTGAGSLDFEGKEFMPCASVRLDSEQRNPSDTYGWWSLGNGTYFAVFNEKLRDLEDFLAVVTPHSNTCRTGITANSGLITSENYNGDLRMVFQVPKCGVHIKENACFAELAILAE
jgi:deoxycytidine triphosphate deaminase